MGLSEDDIYHFCDNKKNITRQLKDMDCMFSWQRTKSYSFAALTCEILFLPLEHIKSISSRNRVISSIYVAISYTVKLKVIFVMLLKFHIKTSSPRYTKRSL